MTKNNKKHPIWIHNHSSHCHTPHGPSHYHTQSSQLQGHRRHSWQGTKSPLQEVPERGTCNLEIMDDFTGLAREGQDSCCKSLESSEANLQTMKSSMLQLSQCCQNFMCRRCHFPQRYWACWTFKVPQDGHVTGIRFKALRCLVAQKMAHRFVRTGCLLTILHSRETSM